MNVQVNNQAIIGAELLDLNGWEPVGQRYQKTITNLNGKAIWVMLWFDQRRQLWYSGEVYGNSLCNVKPFKTLEIALKT